ncbi:hypothetical protein [Aeribacillus composti]|uniref:hypothetical protein n=1 Tax=Aeribacillus composti TaxID=1868734 RepID=UPI002E1CEE94|nr:hypothetical protein [Aeribacillus composti]
MRLFESTFPVSYAKTVLGWYNVTIDDKRYNVAPHIFRKFTDVSKKARLGVAELSKDDIDELIKHSIAL